MVGLILCPPRPGWTRWPKPRAQGIRIRVLTNVLEATDVSLVHVGYARYRAPLLRMGVSCTSCSARAH